MQYRADQVGSLLRPQELIDARTAYNEGRIDSDALRAVEDEAILDILARQRQSGIDIFTDGEYRRYNYYHNMIDAVDGFVMTDEVPLEWRGPGGDAGRAPGRAVGGRLVQKRRLTAHEVAFLKQHAGAPFKVTVPSANQFARGFQPGLTDRFYARREELANDLISITRREIEALIAEGVAYVQIDAPNYTALVDPERRERMRAAGVDPDRALEESIAIDNASVDGLGREDVVLALHMCRGNSRSRWLSEGSYEPIAEKLFSTLNFDRLLLEYDTDRAGGFEPLRFMPKGKDVVLGLVTTKRPDLESDDLLVRRVDEASRFIPLENLAVSPQCGFASAMLGNLLSMDDQQRKLELVARIADRVWG